MPAPQLTVKLSGALDLGSKVPFAEFREFCQGLASCLRKVESVVSEDSHLDYLISDVKGGSVAVTLVPVPRRRSPDTGEEVIGLFVDTVRRLEAGEEIDPRFSREDLRAFRHLAEPLNRGHLSEVRIDGAHITTRFIANIDHLIGGPIPTEGSVTGRLERLNLHHKNEFALYPPIEGVTVTCDFPEEMTDKVISAIKRTVTVFGRLTFRPDSAFPERVQVHGLDIHPQNTDLPKLGDLRGLLRGGTGGKTSVEFLKSIRDE